MATRSVDIRINVDDTDAGKRLDAIAAKLDKLSKGTYTIKLRLDDGGTSARLDDIAAKLDKIGTNTYTPKIGLSGITKADGELDKLDTRLDKIGHKRVTATVHVKTTGGSGAGSGLERLLTGGGGRGGGGSSLEKDAAGAGGSGAGGSAGGFLSFIGGASNSWMGAAIAGLVALAAALTPALAPFAIGGGVGLGGGLIASKLGTTGITNLKADRQAVAQAQAALAAKGANTPAQKLALRQAQAQLSLDQSKYGGFVPFGHATTGLESSALGSLLGAVTGNAPGLLTGGNKGGQVPGTSFLAGLVPILTQIGGFVKSIGPSLGGMFRASLPFVSAFAKVFEQLAKALMPAFLQSMKSITPFLPQIVRGFAILTQGLADFIKDLGPGMKDSVTVFLGLMTLTKGLLIAVAYAADYVAKFLANFGHTAVDVARFMTAQWETLQHNTAVDFDAIRHFIASAWDEIWNNTFARVARGVQDVMNFDDNLRNGISNTYDDIRHSIAQAWDSIWSSTLSTVSRGYHDVLSWFDKFPGAIESALGSLGTMLENIGKAALNDFLAGLKSVSGSIESWFKSFIGGIPGFLMKLLHMSPPHPGSVFFDLGANFMHHLEAGIKSRASSVASTMHGIVGGSGGNAQRIAQSLLGRYGWSGQWGALNSVAMRESGWSMTARNPSSGAYGIAQFINGPSEYYQYGGNPNTAAGQVIGFFNYIKQRYGNPNAAWAHELNFGWYDQGGVLPPGLTMAMNATGHPEQIINPSVTPLGGSGGPTVIQNIYVADGVSPDQAALEIVQSLRKYKTRHGGAALGIG